jgi:hypothetical protein
MPIVCPVEIRSLSRGEFYGLDYKVMKLVFAVHNEMGRFWDERINETEIAARCRAMHLDSVETQVPIRVSHAGFLKTYEVELKAVDTLLNQHVRQALHYNLLLGVNFGKLVNFRPPSSCPQSPQTPEDTKIISAKFCVTRGFALSNGSTSAITR